MVHENNSNIKTVQLFVSRFYSPTECKLLLAGKRVELFLLVLWINNLLKDGSYLIA